jgi:hypothetical protein
MNAADEIRELKKKNKNMVKMYNALSSQQGQNPLKANPRNKGGKAKPKVTFGSQNYGEGTDFKSKEEWEAFENTRTDPIHKNGKLHAWCKGCSKMAKHGADTCRVAKKQSATAKANVARASSKKATTKKKKAKKGHDIALPTRLTGDKDPGDYGIDDDDDDDDDF